MLFLFLYYYYYFFFYGMASFKNSVTKVVVFFWKLFFFGFGVSLPNSELALCWQFAFIYLLRLPLL